METAHIIGWNVVSAKLLSSHLSRHYRCRSVYGWCPPPVQLRSGGTFLAGTKLVQEMNLEKSLEGLLMHSASGLRPPPRFLQHVHHELSLLGEKISLVKEKRHP